MLPIVGDAITVGTVSKSVCVKETSDPVKYGVVVHPKDDGPVPAEAQFRVPAKLPKKGPRKWVSRPTPLRVSGPLYCPTLRRCKSGEVIN